MMYGKNIDSDFSWHSIKVNSIGAELGVWEGDTTLKFLNSSLHIHMVDPWSVQAYLDNKHYDNDSLFTRYEKLVGSTDPKEFQKYYDNVYEKVIKRFKNKSVTIHRMTTTEWFKSFNEKIDWVYVDARHDTAGVLEDLHNSLKILKPGGIIYGDDYGSKPGVTVGVNTFISQTGLKLNNFYNSQYEIIGEK